MQTAIIAYTVIFGSVFIPFSLPILSESTFVAYEDRLYDVLHIPKSALATEHGRNVSTLPGDWADMRGWPELALLVQRVNSDLPPEGARASRSRRE